MRRRSVKANKVNVLAPLQKERGWGEVIKMTGQGEKTEVTEAKIKKAESYDPAFFI